MVARYDTQHSENFVIAGYAMTIITLPATQIAIDDAVLNAIQVCTFKSLDAMVLVAQCLQSNAAALAADTTPDGIAERTMIIEIMYGGCGQARQLLGVLLTQLGDSDTATLAMQTIVTACQTGLPKPVRQVRQYASS